jgi:hypothetical protein
MAINKELNANRITLNPKTRIGLINKFVENKNVEIKPLNKNNISPVNPEQKKVILKAVLNSAFNLSLLSSYSAVYLITPLLIAPFAKVKIMAIKFEKAPINAIPIVPV